MTRITRLQSINNVVMTISFMLCIGLLLAGSIPGFLLAGLGCLMTFVAEKKLERARRALWSQHPRMRRSV